jgi:hypothetical protein
VRGFRVFIAGTLYGIGTCALIDGRTVGFIACGAACAILLIGLAVERVERGGK